MLVADMLSRDEQGSLVTLIGDGGERYDQRCYSDSWVLAQRLRPGAACEGAASVSRVVDARGPAVGLLGCLGRARQLALPRGPHGPHAEPMTK
jgi:hypothetical protein